MHKRTLLSSAALTALGLIATSAFAQTDAPAQQLERVEVTGSAIKRIDAETAVPVTIIKMSDLKAQGVTSIEQIMSSLSAVQLNQGTSQQVGVNRPGFPRHP